MCRSRRELSNAYLLAKIGVDTAENEPLEVWGKSIQYYSFVSVSLTHVGLLAVALAAGDGPTDTSRSVCESHDLLFFCIFVSRKFRFSEPGGARLAGGGEAARGGPPESLYRLYSKIGKISKI